MSKRPLRILTVANVPPDPNSGAAGTVWYTNAALRELGHEVDEIWADDLGPRRIRHGNLHSLLEQPRAYRREVLKAVARTNYDVVMMSQPQAYLAAKSLKKSGFRGLVINRSHGVELRADAILPDWHRRLGVPESRNLLLTSALRKLLQNQWHAVARWSDGIIVPCADDRDSLLDRLQVAPHQVQVIHHGVPCEFLSPRIQATTQEHSQRLLYVGQHAFFKGPTLLAEIVNHVLSERDTLTMTWVTAAAAHGWLRSLIDPSVADRVCFMDWQPHERLIDLYDQHGTFIFPSLVEGAGKASLEAMARGLCVVTGDHSGMKDYVTNGVNGFLCRNGDVQEFSATILQLTLDPSRMKSIGRHAQERSREFPWRRCAERASTFFEKLLDGSVNHVPEFQTQEAGSRV